MKDSSVAIGGRATDGAIKFKGGTTTIMPPIYPLAFGTYQVFRHNVSTTVDTLLAQPDYWIKGKIDNDYVKIPCYKYTP